MLSVIFISKYVQIFFEFCIKQNRTAVQFSLAHPVCTLVGMLSMYVKFTNVDLRVASVKSTCPLQVRSSRFSSKSPPNFMIKVTTYSQNTV